MTAPQPFSARELMAMKFPEQRWAVPGLIPEGLCLIAARAKMGKSWLMLNLSIAVAAGGRALGMAYVEPGDVLYLALEDTRRRLQDRLVTMLADGAEAPERLQLETEWPRLDAGGLDALEEWAKAHPDARLIVLDTFVRIRARGRSREARLYDEDYEALIGLKGLADRHGVAIVVVHHQRKMAATDPLDTVNGTLGLTAGPDTILVLTRARGAADATLHVTGRDVEEATHALSWDQHAGTWSLTEPMAADASAERLAVLHLLEQASGPMRPSAIAASLQRPPGAVRKLTWSMANDGQLGGDGVGGYFLSLFSVTGKSGNTGNAGNGHAA